MTITIRSDIFIVVENEAHESQVPEIWEPEEEKSLSVGKLKYCYLQIARQRFQGKVFINKDTNNPIRVSRDGIMEWWRKSRKREHVISVQLLDYFLENGVFTGESPDYKNRPEIEGTSFLKAPARLMGFRLRSSLLLERGLMILPNSGTTRSKM